MHRARDVLLPDAVAHDSGGDEHVQQAFTGEGAVTAMAAFASATFESVVPRPPPRSAQGAVQWLRANLFDGWQNTLATLVVLGLLAWCLPPLLDWAVVNAVFAPDNAACRAAVGRGACWGVVAEKYRLILFGRYPYAEQWRPLVASVMLMTLLAASCYRGFWRRWLLGAWVVVLAVCFTLMSGGVLGLASVETARWGGLPLTLLLSTVSLVLAFPLAIAVALGRQSKMPAIRTICVTYVELIRGVPLISVLFMASFLFPLFMPQGTTIDVLLRVLAGMTLFGAAYLAEAVRGGLAIGGAGDHELVHRRIQRHFAGHYRQPLRVDRRAATVAGRCPVAQVFSRRAALRGGDLFCLLLLDVALQPLD
jgi:general L-amino acid transport system permease protein